MDNSGCLVYIIYLIFVITATFLLLGFILSGLEIRSGIGGFIVWILMIIAAHIIFPPSKFIGK